LQQKQAAKHGEFVDRSQDIRIVQDYYKHFRERTHIERLEQEEQLRRLGQITDEEPDQCVPPPNLFLQTNCLLL
jgi:hypothetical protein